VRLPRLLLAERGEWLAMTGARGAKPLSQEPEDVPVKRCRRSSCRVSEGHPQIPSLLVPHDRDSRGLKNRHADVPE
jgi:hypothetical protein